MTALQKPAGPFHECQVTKVLSHLYMSTVAILHSSEKAAVLHRGTNVLKPEQTYLHIWLWLPELLIGCSFTLIAREFMGRK